MPLGVYPDEALSDARDLHAEARRKVKNGIDPTHERKVAKLTKGIATENTFKAIAEEWFVRQMENKSDGHKARARRLLDRDLYPSLGHCAIDVITPIEVLATLRKIESRSVDLAHRAK